VALIESFEKTGNTLFKYRGQIPVLIFLLSLPILFLTNEPLYQGLYAGKYTLVRLIWSVVAVLISLSGLALRAYTVSTTPKGTSGRNRSGQVADSLNTKGIYSVVRHPLYLANYLIWAGVLVFSLNIWAFLIVSLVYWLYYERIMFAEEAFLRSRFGADFEEWASRVPAIIPNWALFEKGDMSFSFKTFLRREYATFFSTVFSFVLVDYALFILSFVQFCPCRLSYSEWVRPSLYVLAVALVITLILRTLKHHTSILKKDVGRD
jgi:protein-S-isoprenylcysteine O-methyltransferase Ste14